MTAQEGADTTAGVQGVDEGERGEDREQNGSDDYYDVDGVADEPSSVAAGLRWLEGPHIHQNQP